MITIIFVFFLRNFGFRGLGREGKGGREGRGGEEERRCSVRRRRLDILDGKCGKLMEKGEKEWEREDPCVFLRKKGAVEGPNK